MDEAYEENGMNCVVRQICALYRMERLDVEQEFDMINDMIPDPPRAEGISPLQILEWCRRNQKNGYIVWNNTLIAKHEEEVRDHHVPLCASK